jgi:hypothetical protein
MRGKLTKPILTRFAAGVPERCPGFEIYEKENDMIKWKRQIAADLFLYVLIVAVSRRDQFIVRVQWNQNGELTSGVGINQPERPFGAEALQRIRGCKNGEDFWDLEPEITDVANRMTEIFKATGKIPDYPDPVPIEVALERVAPAVDDALHHLSAYGMPFLKRVAAAHNAPWPDDLAALY